MPAALCGQGIHLTIRVCIRGGDIDEDSKLSKEMLGKALQNMGKNLSDQEVNGRCCASTPCCGP